MKPFFKCVFMFFVGSMSSLCISSCDDSETLIPTNNTFLLTNTTTDYAVLHSHSTKYTNLGIKITYDEWLSVKSITNVEDSSKVQRDGTLVVSGGDVVALSYIPEKKYSSYSCTVTYSINGEKLESQDKSSHYTKSYTIPSTMEGGYVKCHAEGRNGNVFFNEDDSLRINVK